VFKSALCVQRLQKSQQEAQLQIATWLLSTAYRKLPACYPMVQSHNPCDLPFSQNTAWLAYHSALWLFKITQGQWFSCNPKERMPLPISD